MLHYTILNQLKTVTHLNLRIQHNLNKTTLKIISGNATNPSPLVLDVEKQRKFQVNLKYVAKRG